MVSVTMAPGPEVTVIELPAALAAQLAALVAPTAEHSGAAGEAGGGVGSVAPRPVLVMAGDGAGWPARLLVLPAPDDSEPELLVDAPRRRAVVRGQEVALSPTEFDLLTVLVAAGGHAVSRRELLSQIRGRAGVQWRDPATITEHVYRLRTKIETDPSQPRLLLTARGVGYRMAADDCRLLGAA